MDAAGEGRLMEFGELWPWLTDPAHWSGTNGIPARLLQHVTLSAIGIAASVAIALPVGLLIGHTRKGEFLAVTVANLGRAIPSFAIISLAFQIVAFYWTGLAFGYLPTAVALTLLGLPPILTNAYVGIQQVDADTVEAARGMGLRPRQVLARLELPLAAPLVIAGIRTAAVQIVATATLWALIGGEGLGRYIVDGFAQQDDGRVLAGAVLVAALAIATELAFALLEWLVTPRTSARGRRRGAARVRGAAPEASPIG